MDTAVTIMAISDQRRITRQMRKAMREIFPFLQLPTELRYAIYEFTISVEGIQKCIAGYYEKAKDTTSIKQVNAPLVYKRPPTLFRINRQIYLESIGLLSKQGITFDHGMLDLAQIEDFARPQFFRTLTSIEINHSGHPFLKHNIVNVSWLGYMTLIRQLGEILAPGHKLKQFTLNFDVPDLLQHTLTCWDGTFQCGFRDTLKAALGFLRNVRRVGNVTFNGLPELFASELKVHMESTPVTFFDLPRNIRDKIYAMSADWSEVSAQMVRGMEVWPSSAAVPTAQCMKTPNVLLLNRQIAAEAQHIIRTTPLVLDLPSVIPNAYRSEAFRLDEFISCATVPHIRHLVLKIDNWLWIHILRKFIAALLPKPGRLQSLETFALHLTDRLKHHVADGPEGYPDNRLHHMLCPLQKLRNMRNVIFTGDLPACYTMPLRAIMQSPPDTPTAILPRLQAIRFDEILVEIENDEIY